jgi:hypothetical protein
MTAIVEIRLPVYQTFSLHHLLKRNDPVINQEVLNLGCQTFLMQQTVVEKNLHDSHLAELEAHHKEEKDKLLSQLKAMETEKHQLQQKIQFLQKECETAVSSHSEKWDSAYQRGVKTMQDSLHVLQERIRIQDEISGMRTKVEQLFDRFVSSSSPTLGIIGESIIEEYIHDKFSTGNVEPTSREKASGDLILNLGRLKLLIETKNETYIQKNDISKFWRDIDVQKETKINAALFISLHDTYLLEGKKHFHFEVRDNIPVVYLSGVNQNLNMVGVMVSLLKSLIDSGLIYTNLGGNTDSYIEKFNALTNTIYQVYDTIRALHDITLEDKQALNKLQHNIRCKENIIEETTRKLILLATQYPDIQIKNNNSKISISKPSDGKLLLQQIVVRAREYLEENGDKYKNKNGTSKKLNRKTLITLGFKKSEIEAAGGMKVIKDYVYGNREGIPDSTSDGGRSTSSTMVDMYNDLCHNSETDQDSQTDDDDSEIKGPDEYDEDIFFKDVRQPRAICNNSHANI